MSVFPRTLFVLLAVLLMWSPQATVNGKRLRRENVRWVSPLRGNRWSSWYTALVPSSIALHNSRRYEPRAKSNYGLIDSTIRTRFVGTGYDNGIYELRVSKGRRHYVVYIGRSYSKSAHSINNRIRQYCRYGSHIRDKINRAMRRGYTLSVRAQNINGPSNNVLKGETKYLAKYDYAWNQKNNGRIRGNVPP